MRYAPDRPGMGIRSCCSSDNRLSVSLEVSNTSLCLANFYFQISDRLSRYARLRRAHSTASRPHRLNRHDQFSSDSVPHRRHFPRTTGLPLESISGPVPHTLVTSLSLSPSLFYPMPPRGTGRRGHQPIRGADIDAGGRRLGPRDPDDLEHGDEDRKDELPAYDGFDRPPKYLDPGAVGVSHLADIPLQELNRVQSRSTATGNSDPQTTATHAISQTTLHDSGSEEDTLHSHDAPQAVPALSVRPTSPSPAYEVTSSLARLNDDSHDHDREGR